jgi:hypothetical protein
MFQLTEEYKQGMRERHAVFMAGGSLIPTLSGVQKQLDDGEITEERFEWLCYLWDLRPQDKERHIREVLEMASNPGF